MEFAREVVEMEVLNVVRNCFPLVEVHSNQESLLLKIELLHCFIATASNSAVLPWANGVLDKLEMIIQIVLTSIESPVGMTARPAGRPAIPIPASTIEYLLSIKFKVTEISKFFGVSRDTIFRRMRDHNITVHSTYSEITDEDLKAKVVEILSSFPNTGYKRMKGFLLDAGLKLTDLRVREIMRVVDPLGVHLRTLSNRAIVRRQYFVSYFNELWHLDTNMKLIRWNIVIRSCIDGKTRTVVYLDASGDNTAESNAVSFLKAVAQYGIPSRTRSDKGGENVIIAQFMIEQRGVGRSSHICGRSVHNQRIERYWRDVFSGYTGTIYNVFTALEEDGILNIDDPRHVKLLHYVFLPRINDCLEKFRNAWNSHPLSSENNYTPIQLMIMSLPPEDYDLSLDEDQLRDVYFVCNNLDDVPMLINATEESIATPVILEDCLNAEEMTRLRTIQIMRQSPSFGYDIFIEAVRCLSSYQY